MWSFFRRRERGSAAPAVKSFAQLVGEIGDFSDFAKHDAALKFWIPEPVEKGLEVLCQREGRSLSDCLREFLTIHCYGVYAYYAIRESVPGVFAEGMNMPAVFSIGEPLTPPGKKRVITYWVVELGKNVAPVKLWLPGRLKRDLSTLAEHVGLTTSNYVREIVVSRVFGHGMLPKRPEMLAQPSAALEKWIVDDDDAWTCVSEAQAVGQRLVNIRSEWVPDAD